MGCSGPQKGQKPRTQTQKQDGVVGPKLEHNMASGLKLENKMAPGFRLEVGIFSGWSILLKRIAL